MTPLLCVGNTTPGAVGAFPLSASQLPRGVGEAPRKQQAQYLLPASDLASHLLTLHSAQSKHSATLGQAEFDSKKQAEDSLVVQ